MPREIVARSREWLGRAPTELDTLASRAQLSRMFLNSPQGSALNLWQSLSIERAFAKLLCARLSLVFALLVCMGCALSAKPTPRVLQGGLTRQRLRAVAVVNVS